MPKCGNGRHRRFWSTNDLSNNKKRYTMEQKEKEQMLFVQLISSLHGAALMHMGKMKNPATEAIDRNLPQAEMTIEMLDMLKQKTAGNLSAEEERFVATVISELKLNYVDEKAKEKQ